MLSPTTLQFAYMEVGPQMRASATSITFLSMSLGNYLVAFIESILSDVSTNDKQWIYLAISTVFLIVFLFLSKFWFDSRLEAEAESD
ncbi:hypothetical protein DSO57_1010358 [Entomophthora muscae]|uniref:Uncharacterized protein n=1 Tax=Entomophthora muscae TaxID=34485 RepID=A0ACC2UFJ9_9FUNG|nr:hypothetical protein DSO57_1010358 [Entomophthora muscae]